MQSQSNLDTICINTIRTLAMDAVQAANSGHAGASMALAPVAYCLWQQFLRFDPQDPISPNRDRFVLSAGHAVAVRNHRDQPVEGTGAKTAGSVWPGVMRRGTLHVHH